MTGPSGAALAMRPHVFIATPSYCGAPAMEHSRARHLNVLDLLRHRIAVSEETLPGTYVHLGRNKLVSMFRATTATHLFFWDDDVGGPGDGIRRLLEHMQSERGGDRDIVGGVYPKKESVKDERGVPVFGRHKWPVKVLSGAEPDERGLFECEGLPTGFMLIRRGVIEAMVKAYATRIFFDDDGTPHYDLFPTGISPAMPHNEHGPCWWGEDYAFTAMARALGFRAWMDPNMTFEHVGRHAWKANFHAECVAPALAKREAQTAAEEERRLQAEQSLDAAVDSTLDDMGVGRAA